MNRTLAHWLTRLYPRRWRERYGEEFEEFLVASGSSIRSGLDTAACAVRERVSPSLKRPADARQESFARVLAHPSALLPLTLSLAALLVVMGHVLLVGPAREADEGTAAHLWQLLMAAQLAALLFFAGRWLPRAPRPALGVLAIQAGGLLMAIAPVWLLNL